MLSYEKLSKKSKTFRTFTELTVEEFSDLCTIMESQYLKHEAKRLGRKHFKKLKVKIGDQVKDVWKKEKDKPVKERELITFVSDKFEGYKIGFNYCFHRFGRLVHGVPIACKKYGLEHNNNAIERHNGDFKQRYKVTRI